MATNAPIPISNKIIPMRMTINYKQKRIEIVIISLKWSSFYLTVKTMHEFSVIVPQQPKNVSNKMNPKMAIRAITV